MDNKQLFALIDSLTKGQGEMSKTPMGREVLYVTSPSMNKTGTSAPEGVDIQELIRGMIRSNSPIKSQFSSMLGRNQLTDKPEAAKSIDDILKQSVIAEFLSKAVSDKTNVDVKEDSQESDRSTYGGGTLGVVDSPMTMQMLMRNQEPVPQDTTGLPKMDIETLFRLLSPQMQEPTPSR